MGKKVLMVGELIENLPWNYISNVILKENVKFTSSQQKGVPRLRDKAPPNTS
jgi:hypothetical protein